MTLITETDGEFTDMLALDTPVSDPAILALFGGSRQQSVRNLANPDLPFSVIGSPGIAANYVDCNSVNFFDTRVRDSESDTVFFVSKRPAAALGDNGRIYGNAQTRISYLSTDDKSLIEAVQPPTGSPKTYGRPTDAAIWKLHATRWTSNVGPKLWDFTAAPSDGSPITSADPFVRQFGLNTMGVGNATGSTATDPAKTAVQIAAFAYFPRALADADVLTMAGFLRSLMAARSITV